jgi:hypothetical protein
LDAAATLTPAVTAEIVDEIHREFSEKWGSTPLGIVAKCYLGVPFEAHTLALDDSIIEHYERGRALPGGLEKARSLTGTDTYVAIEVYTDRLVCIRHDGTVIALEG